jgi:hypothetical protein
VAGTYRSFVEDIPLAPAPNAGTLLRGERSIPGLETRPSIGRCCQPPPAIS